MKTVRLNDETIKDLLSRLLQRSPQSYGEFEERVAAIVSDVRENGDEAVFRLTRTSMTLWSACLARL